MGITGSTVGGASVMAAAVVVIVAVTVSCQGDTVDPGGNIHNGDLPFKGPGDPLFIEHIGGQKELRPHCQTQFPGAGSVIMGGTSRREHCVDLDPAAADGRGDIGHRRKSGTDRDRSGICGECRRRCCQKISC